MKILQIVPHFDASFGGPVRSAATVTIALQNLGHEVTTLAPDGEPDSWPAAWKSFKSFRVPGSPLPVSAFSVPLLWWLKRNARDFGLVHVHLNRSPTLLLAVLLLRWLKLPYIVQTHGMCRPWTGPKRLIDEILTRPAIAGAKATLCLASDEAQDLSRWTMPRKIELMDNAIDLDTSRPVEHPPGTPHFLFCARLHPRKGLDVFIRAAALLQNEGFAATYTVAGADEGSKASAMELAQSHHLSVDWAGSLSRQRTVELMRQSTCLVHPAENEPFGMSMIESMSQGVPVIAAATSRLAPRFVENAAAVTVRDSRPTAYAEAMRDLATDDRRWHAVSRAGAEWASATFSIQSLSRRLSRWYGETSG